LKARYLVSGCLLGENCKYDGKNNYTEKLDSFRKLGILVGVCPEVLGGLPTPRTPSEIVDGYVYTKDGVDVSSEFNAGAEYALKIGKYKKVKKAILKSNSPSCGNEQVYDGTFSNTLTYGDGVTVSLLKENGYRIYDENTNCIYDAIVVAAGSSERSGLTFNKVFEYCKNKSCIESAVEPFLCDYLCRKVIVVAKKEEIKLMESFFDFTDRVEIVEGGQSREESVLNGLNRCERNIVLIHDGARPYISDELKDSIVDQMLDGADNVVPYLNKEFGSEFDYSIDNKCIQTPQAYKKDNLLDAFKDLDLSKYRDESSIYGLKHNINYVDGDIKNTKLTVIEDIKKWREYDEDNL